MRNRDLAVELRDVEPVLCEQLGDRLRALRRDRGRRARATEGPLAAAGEGEGAAQAGGGGEADGGGVGAAAEVEGGGGIAQLEREGRRREGGRRLLQALRRVMGGGTVGTAARP